MDVHAGIEVCGFIWPLRHRNFVGFCNDGNTLVSGSGGQGTGNYLLRVWNVHPLADRNSLHGTGVTMRSVAVSADGNRIAAGDDAGQIHMWNYESSELNPLPAPEAATDGTEPVLQVAHNGRVRAIAFSPDKALMATAGDDNLVWLWDAHSMEKVQLLDAHHGWVRSVSFSPDNKYVASAGEDWRVRVWQIGLDKPVFVLREHEDIRHPRLSQPTGSTLLQLALTGQFGFGIH